MDVPVYNMQGKETGSVSIDEAALGGVVNPALIKQAYVRYHANLRQGSARNKGRGDLTKTGKKWYKQKGTGRARHGDRKVPIMVGGGVTFAKRKKREDYRLDMPKKMRRKANRNALLAKLVDGEVKVIDSLQLDAPKTRAFIDLMASLGLDRGTLLALSGDAEKSRNARLSARNVDDITLCRADQLTAFEMLNHRYLVIGKDELEAWLAGPSSQTTKEAKVNPMGRTDKAAKVRKKDPRKERAQARKAAAAGKGGE